MNFKQRLERLEALEAEQRRGIPRDATLTDVWPLFVFGVQQHCIWHDIQGAPRIHAGVEQFARNPRHRAAVEGHYRILWPDAGITYDDVLQVCAIATNARQRGHVLIPLWVEDIDDMLAWYADDKLMVNDNAGVYYRVGTGGRVELQKSQAWNWLRWQRQPRPATPDEAAAWLQQIRPGLVELQGYDPKDMVRTFEAP